MIGWEPLDKNKIPKKLLLKSAAARKGKIGKMYNVLSDKILYNLFSVNIWFSTNHENNKKFNQHCRINQKLREHLIKHLRLFQVDRLLWNQFKLPLKFAKEIYHTCIEFIQILPYST